MSVSAIDEDVVFDHPGAADLAERFRMTADELERQTGADPRAAGAGGQGRVAGSARRRSSTSGCEQCCADGQELAGSLPAGGRRARGDVGRRARESSAAASWPGRGRTATGSTGSPPSLDNVHDFVFGEDDIPPPPPPAPQPRFLVAACAPRSRGC